jgi:hypothetical protein
MRSHQSHKAPQSGREFHNPHAPTLNEWLMARDRGGVTVRILVRAEEAK